MIGGIGANAPGNPGILANAQNHQHTVGNGNNANGRSQLLYGEYQAGPLMWQAAMGVGRMQ